MNEWIAFCFLTVPVGSDCFAIGSSSTTNPNVSGLPSGRVTWQSEQNTLINTFNRCCGSILSIIVIHYLIQRPRIKLNHNIYNYWYLIFVGKFNVGFLSVVFSKWVLVSAATDEWRLGNDNKIIIGQPIITSPRKPAETWYKVSLFSSKSYRKKINKKKQ